MTDEKKTYILLTLTTIIWGIQPLCAKLLVAEWSPVALTYIRYFFISAILFSMLYWRRDKGLFPPKDCWVLLIGMGMSGIAGNSIAQFTGLKYSTITNCTLISATSPAVTAFLSALFIRERLVFLSWLGILVSFSGIILIVSHGMCSTIMTIDFNRGDLLFFVCQIFWSMYSLLGLKAMKKLSAIAATAWAGLFGAIFTLFFGLFSGQAALTELTVLSWWAFFYMVFLGGVMAMIFWNIGVKNAGPSLTAIFQNITPVVGMLGGWFFFAEVIGWTEILGALIILSGVYLTTHQNNKFV